ncbi:hypothetical protein [Planobispora rosea]|uniref:hypothetical protein n=1 Tax=Planobispora rosea TaxID=35762 RepID=UPI00083A37AB|nr:hypothetical protein [Planobispora rosea]
MTRHRVTIAPNTPTLGSHQLLVDGHDISRGVASLRMSLDAGEVPAVELELRILELDRMDLEDAELYIPDATRGALIALGWTPPGAESQDEALRAATSCVSCNDQPARPGADFCAACTPAP